MTHEEIRITPGFDLNMDIIHAYAPIYLNEKDPINKLLSVYKILLEEISKKKYKKVLLCSLGTGFHGYFHEDIAKPLITLLNNYCNTHDVNIYFNNINQTYTDIYLKEYLKDLANEFSNVMDE